MISNSTKIVRSVADTCGQIHAFELSGMDVFVDGRPATIQVEGAEVILETVEPHLRCAVIAASFWEAIAGSAPDATDAGLLFAHCIMLQAAYHRAIQDLRRVVSQVTPMVLPVPEYRFDARTREALELFDGTELTTQFLSRLLKQSPETIALWAAQVGNVVVSQDPSVHQAETIHFGHLSPDAGASLDRSSTEPLKSGIFGQNGADPEKSVRLRWTAEMDAQLIAMYEASQATTMKAVAREIAQRYGWPESAVQARFYVLKLPSRVPSEPLKQDTESSTTTKEED